MRLLGITTEGFRGVPDRAFDFTHPGTSSPLDVVIVTGGPGAGKTSLLEAIIAAKEDVGAYGPARARGACVRAGARSARVDATWALSPAERTRAGADATVVTRSTFGDAAPPVASHPEALRALFREHSCDRSRGKVEYFHAERSLAAARGTEMGSVSIEVRHRLTASNEKHRSLRAYVVGAVTTDAMSTAGAVRERGIVVGARRFGHEAEIRDALRPFLRDKAFDGIEPAPRGHRLRFRCRSGEVLDLDGLGAAEQQGVLFALTFRQLGLAHSLVLIDEPELHVHASERTRFLQAVVGLDRDNQIIVATGSAEILAAASPGQVIDLSRPAPAALRVAG
jgi:hypothetical protein